jgi:hypothetical protein
MLLEKKIKDSKKVIGTLGEKREVPANCSNGGK